MKQLSTPSASPGRYLFSLLLRYLTALLLLLAAPLAHGQTWQSVVTSGHNGNSSSEANVSAFDAAGNVYMAGMLMGPVQFGNVVLTGVGKYDMYVAKYSTITQSFVWAVQATSSPNTRLMPRGLAVSGNNIYVGGTFGEFASFGSTTLVCDGYSDVFLAKIVDQGTPAAFGWAQRVGGNASDYLTGLVSSGNSVYLGGSIDSPAVPFGTTTLGNTGGGVGYVAKLTDTGPAGNFVWALPIASGNSQGGVLVNCLAMNSNAVYLTGEFRATATFGNSVLTSRGSSDAYVAKVVDAGAGASFGWVQRVGGTGSEAGRVLALSGNAVYASGNFNSAALPLGAATLAYSGNLYGHGLYVTKLVDNGSTASVAWATQAGAPGILIDPDAMVAANGSLYLVGQYLLGSPSFGAIALPAAVNTTANQSFVTRLVDAGSSGSFAWAQYGRANSAGTYNAANGVGIGNNSLLVTGTLRPSVSLGTFSFPNAVATSTATSYAFIASLTDPALTATTPAGPLAGTSLYPNPALATVTVQLPPVPGAAAATLTITDALGRVVRTTAVALPAAGLRHPLDLSGLPGGLYAVRVAAGGNTATHRLVVE